MAKFSCGQRARFIRPRANVQNPWPAGLEVVVVREVTEMEWKVSVDIGKPSEYVVMAADGAIGFVLGDQLEPLTGPGQKEFKAEDILHLPNLPDFKTMPPEWVSAWGGR